MNKKMKLDVVLVFIGISILLLMAILAILDPMATDMLSAIPSSILGAALFISGYVSLKNNGNLYVLFHSIFTNGK